jgi:Right handed beta helix region/Secretion system C-terminal sorting domain
MYKSLRFLTILLISTSSLLSKAQTPDTNNILYVNVNVSGGTSSGNSWANAIPQLADALKWARQQNNFTSGNPLKIYVSKGTYKPMYNAADASFTTNANRDNAFVMVNNVQLYGGFDPANNIDDLTHTRDYTNTILSGDIGTVGTATDNTYHVLISSGGIGTARLDGFMVTGGYSTSSNSGLVTVNSNAIYRSYGGGMYNVSSSPVVTNCSFTNNLSPYGGGIFNVTDAAPSITNCSFTGNNSSGYGGGMANQSTSSALTVSGCTFSGNNSSGYGGGMYNYTSSPTITNCSFIGNSAGNSGGGMANQSLASPTIANCSFTGNTLTTSFGSAMYNASSSPAITNSSFTGNTGASPGYAIYDNSSSSLTLTNVIIANNGGNGLFSLNSTIAMQNSIVWEAINGTYTPKYSLIKGSTSTSDGNIKAVTYSATDIFTDYSGGDYTLKPNSPAINAGSNALFAGLSASTLDLAGNPRVYNYNQSGVIDLGAYEYQNILPGTNNILYVNAYVSGGTGTGNSWTNAIPQLADALKFARINNNYTAANPLKIYVAKGTYKPMYNATDGNFTADGGRKNAFVMVNNVQIYGGFDPDNNIKTLNDARISPSLGGTGSVLSGDLGVANDISDNAYHVVIASGSIGNALLDGFTITDGNANAGTNTTVGGNSLSDNHGAGIYNFGSSAAYKNLVIKNNKVEWDGAGMINDSASPVVSNVLFVGNYAQYKGTIINYNNSSPVLVNVTITGNTSDNYSGIFNGSSTTYIYNSIIWDNKINGNAATAGADIANDGAGHATVKNSITQSYTTGNTADNNLVNTNPLFFNVANGDYTLGTASPAINKGSNAYYTDADKGNGSLTDKDLLGNKRLVNSSIDIGAYENQTVLTEPDANNVLYVNFNATGEGSGNTWANAIPQLADALKWARAKNSFTTANPLKIYVAKGTYKPMYNAADASYTTDGGRDNAFVMVKNVQLYGGFAGTETALEQRNWAANATILSGDIGTVGVNTDNTYHVVVSSGEVGNAKLDGFTVTGGYSTAGNNQNISVNSYGVARYYGGGMFNYYASPTVTNCIFSANTAYYGSGMFNYYASSTLTNCGFTGNKADYGGGMFNSSSLPIITNCNFTANTSTLYGGGMYNASFSLPTITNSSFTGNSAPTYGGGMYNSSSSPTLINTTIANNGSGGFYTYSGTPILRNTIIWETVTGSYIATYSLIKGVNPTGTGNINATSLAVTDIFKDYAAGDYTLKNGSPVIAKGDNQLYWNAVNGGVAPPSSGGAGGGSGLDLSANPRIYNYATGGTIDMGAYEYQGLLLPTISGFADITKTYGDADFTLTAPTSSNNGAFTYTGNNTSVCTISGSTVTIVGAGTATITATQQASADYDTGTKTLTLTVNKASQTINFAALDPKTTSTADFALTATASSTLAVTYTSSNTAVAEVYWNSGWKVKIKGEGNTNITASQTGDSNYLAATNVVQQLTIIGAPLPVTLVSYSAKPEGNYAKLEWKTTNERNNKGFEIWRKVESLRLKVESGDNDGFVRIGEVSAASYNLEPKTYNFTDKQPLNGINFYKLVQIDNNGTATELGIRTVNFGLQTSDIRLYPNLTKDKITLTFTPGKYHSLSLSDNLGRVLQQRNISTQSAGEIVNLSAYPIGVYFVRLQMQTASIVKKVIKQ